MKSNNFKRGLALFVMSMVGAVVSDPAFAGRQSGNVDYSSSDRTFGKGVVTFRLSGGVATEKPSCASKDDLRWALNVGSGSAADQYIYSSLLSAMASGWRVQIVGTGLCSTVGWLEDIAYIEILR